MSIANNDFVVMQRMIIDLYNKGHLLEPYELTRSVNELTDHMIQMVKKRKQEALQIQEIYLFTNFNTKHLWKHKVSFDTRCDMSCPICMEIHNKTDSLTTECCKHEYGKSCFTTWMKSRHNVNKQCPTCRTASPSIIMYNMYNMYNNKKVIQPNL